MKNAFDIDAAFQLLLEDPARAEAYCRAGGADPGARLLLAAARRLQNDCAGALALTDELVRAFPNWPGAYFEHAMALGGLGRHADAFEVLRALERIGGIPGLWREAGDQLYALGDKAGADQVYLRHLASTAYEPVVHHAVAAQSRNDAGEAERWLMLQLQRHPNDVLAMRILAEHWSAQGRFKEAQSLLRQCLERTPSFALGRYGLAMVLFHDHQLQPALEQLELLLEREPDRLEYLYLQAETLNRLGEFERAATCLERILSAAPDDAKALAMYGNVLRTLGRRAECEFAYKRAIELRPDLGEADWGLANLKTFAFQASDVDAMRRRLPGAVGSELVSLMFALGKALEDQGEHGEAFEIYKQANAARRAAFPHDRDKWAKAVRRARAVYTPEFFAARAGSGSAGADPIFVVGMPRSGSTLVEQILASHSAVEGTMELNELLDMAKRLETEGDFPELLRETPLDRFRELGEEYLSRTRVFRRSGAANFIDKMPNNFLQIGLIQLILPNARIVDVRRNPLACSVSMFKQHWATGQDFAYDLQDIGAFYRAYVELMSHFDEVLPNRVHRVIYERLIGEPELETRALLDACGLTFEEQCLRFYETKRAIRTPSSEQVRRPINTDGLDYWRNFEPWLDPLKHALGPVLEAYPNTPPLAPL